MGINFGAFLNGAMSGANFVRGIQDSNSRREREQRAAKADEDYRVERKSIVDDYMRHINPPQAEQAAQGDQRAGNQKPQVNEFSARMQMYERLSMASVKHNPDKIEDFMKMKDKIKGLRDEGMFEAYQYFQGTGDMAGAVERFNQYGKKKIDPATLKEEQVQDPLLGRPYSRVKGKYEDGSVFVFDPVRMAEAAGGIKAFMDRRGKEGDQAIKTRGKQAELAAEYGLKGELAEKGHGLTMAEIAARGTQDRKTVAARGAEDRRTKSVADAGEKAVFKATEGMKVLVSRYGGKLEGGMWFPDEANRDVAHRASFATTPMS